MVSILAGLFGGWLFEKGLDLAFDNGLQKISQEALGEVINRVISTSFDCISDKYPIYKEIEKMTFWDFVGKNISEQLKENNYNFNCINDDLRNVLQKNSEMESNKINEIITDLDDILLIKIANEEILFRLIVLQLMKLNYYNDKIKNNAETLNSYHIKNKDTVYITEELKNYYISLNRRLIIEQDSIYMDRQCIFENGITKEITIENLIHGEKYVIIGEAGYGKTYYLRQYLCKLLQQDNYRIPVLIDLAAYGREFRSIIEGVLVELEPFLNNLTDKIVRELLKENKLFLLLDGLDEINDKDLFGNCITDLRNLAKRYADISIILTCRENQYYEQLDGLYKQLNLKPLSKKQIDDYLNDVKFAEHTSLSNDHYALFGNPLLLKIAKEVIINNNGYLTKNKSVLYKHFYLYLIEKWNKRKGYYNDNNISIQEILCYLGKLAFDKFDNGFMEMLELQEHIANNFQNHVQKVYDILIKSNILRIDIRGNIKFYHKTFKEYFAGWYLQNSFYNSEKDKVIKSYINKKSWFDTIVFAIGAAENIPKQDSLYDLILDNNLKLFISCVNANSDYIDTKDEKAEEQFAYYYLKTFFITYKKMIDIYFPQLADTIFSKDNGEYIKNNNELSIVGCLTESIYLDYTFVCQEESAIVLLSEDEYTSFLNNYKKKQINITHHFNNIAFRKLLKDNPRFIAINLLKSNIKAILNARKLINSPYLICETIEEIRWSDLIKKKTVDEKIVFIENYIQKIIEKSRQDDNDLNFRILYKKLDVYALRSYFLYMKKQGMEYKDFILPSSDIEKPTTGHWIWNFYSDERMTLLIRKFFEYAVKSILFMIDENFNNLKTVLYEKLDFPYKYHVDAKLVGNSDDGEGTLQYYRIPARDGMDNEPEVDIVDNIDTFDITTEKIRKRFEYESFSITHSRLSMLLTSINSNEGPLMAFVYKNIEKCIEDIIGKM